MIDPMSDIADRYDRVSADFAATVDAVPADRWDSPSPCEGWTARDVVSHIVDNHRTFEEFVGRGLGEVPSVADDPAAAYAAARDVVARHLHDPDTAEASFEGEVFGHMTFAQGIDRFLSADLVIHRWDLARAAGFDVTMPAEEIARIREAAEGYGDAMRGPGAFGPPIDPPADADEQTRLLAFLGRKA
jgi:uncharacterized protein (TIGR03086 family)